MTTQQYPGGGYRQRSGGRGRNSDQPLVVYSRVTVLLEYFAGEKSAKSTKNLTFAINYCVLTRIVCIY